METRNTRRTKRVKFLTIDRDEKKIDAMKRRSEMAISKLKEIHELELNYKPELI